MLRPKFPFLPEGKSSGGILPWVIAVMMYLTALAAIGSLALSKGMSAWSGELDLRLTVQVVHDVERIRNEQVDAVIDALSKTRGVASVQRLSNDETAALLEPWLGEGAALDDLPVPALIDVELDPLAPATPETLGEILARVAPDARLDGHSRWLGQVKRLGGVIVGTLSVILALVLLATIAIVVFGTRARLAMYDQTVEIMHLIGADDALIAREFQWRFLLQGLRGGLIGALAALFTLFLLGLSGGSSELGLLPQIEFDFEMLVILLSVPLISGLLTMITARATVLRALHRLV